MPPNYRESQLAGTEWQRARRVVVENPFLETPSILYVLETALQTGSRTITEPAGNLGENFDPAASFPMLDPITGEPTGQMASHQDLYNILNSHFMYLAKQRDDAEANGQPPQA